MDRVIVVDRGGNQSVFIGANRYVVKANWLGGLTVFGDGVPIGFWWKPISAAIGIASSSEVDKFVEGREQHRAKLMGVKLDSL